MAQSARVYPARPVHVPGRDNISCVTNNLQKLAARASRPATARTRHPRHAARALDTRPGLGSSNALISASGFLRGVHGIFGRTRHLCEKGRGGGGIGARADRHDRQEQNYRSLIASQHCVYRKHIV